MPRHDASCGQAQKEPGGQHGWFDEPGGQSDPAQHTSESGVLAPAMQK
jgi:hypothetical protein